MIKGKRALKIFRFLEFFRKKCLSFREKILEFEFFGLSLSFWALEFFSRRLKKTPVLEASFLLLPLFESFFAFIINLFSLCIRFYTKTPNYLDIAVKTQRIFEKLKETQGFFKNSRPK